MKNLLYRNLDAALIVTGVAMLGLGFALSSFLPRAAEADVATFCSKSFSEQYNVATGTPVTMSAGTATTTLTLDNCTDRVTSLDVVTLLVQHTASTTSSTLQINIEYSQDGIDWYEDEYFNYKSLDGTTTPSTRIDSARTFQSKFASSSPGGIAIPGANVAGAMNFKALQIPMPTRYVRAVFTAPAGSAKMQVWAQFVAKKPTNSQTGR